jgi:hypothetical protein
MIRPCPCGSGLPSWWEHDARGIPLARACDACVDEKLAAYRPEILTDPAYLADEPIEDDDLKADSARNRGPRRQDDLTASSREGTPETETQMGTASRRHGWQGSGRALRALASPVGGRPRRSGSSEETESGKEAR